MPVLNPYQQFVKKRILKDTTSKELSLLSITLWRNGYRYFKNDRAVFGRPQLVFRRQKIAVFIDAEFFHGKDWNTDKYSFKPTLEWHKIIEKNIDKDIKVNTYLSTHGWTVIRFWNKEVQEDLDSCVNKIQDLILQKKNKSLAKTKKHNTINP